MSEDRTRRAGPRARISAAVGAGLIAAAGLAFVAERGTEPRMAERAPAEKPVLLLLTTLPVLFDEEFGIGGGSPALSALEKRYRVVPIDVADAASLKRGRLLLMAHPLAQPAEHLVELDAWVRGGGRLVLLADPALDWHSERPFGDPLRPPPSFADTGLLKHWGLTLDAPDQRGPAARKVDGRDVLAASPGRLVGNCPTEGEGLVARCRIRRGKATIVADADFLNVEELDGPKDDNLNALLAELATIEQR